MADRDLKTLFGNIQVDESELATYRSSLEDRLSRPPLTWAEQLHGLLSVPVIRYCLPVLLLCTVIALYQQTRGSPLESLELERLQAFVERNGDNSVLYRTSEDMQQSDSPIVRLNGLYVRSTLGTGEAHILASVQGLIADPRAEFRAYYLDYLLTHADEAYYDLDYLERLLDRERDPECRELLLELIGIAERRQRSEPVFI